MNMKKQGHVMKKMKNTKQVKLNNCLTKKKKKTMRQFGEPKERKKFKEV